MRKSLGIVLFAFFLFSWTAVQADPTKADAEGVKTQAKWQRSNDVVARLELYFSVLNITDLLSDTAALFAQFQPVMSTSDVNTVVALLQAASANLDSAMLHYEASDGYYDEADGYYVAGNGWFELGSWQAAILDYWDSYDTDADSMSECAGGVARCEDASELCVMAALIISFYVPVED